MTISGILALAKKYGNAVVDQACKRACQYSAYSYKIVKKICENGIINFPTELNESYINPDVTYAARDLSEYSKLARLGDT